MPTACAGEDLAEIDFLLAQTDASATGDHDDFIVQRIVDVRQSSIDTQWMVDRPLRDISSLELREDARC